MTTVEIDAIVNDYFRRLEALLAGLPPAEREPLIAEIRAHVTEARAALAVESEAAIREVLERVGDPGDIAAEALGEPSPGRRWWSRPATRVAAGVAVVAIAAVLAVVLTGSAAKVARVTVAPTVSVGGFPTGVAVDTNTDTAYVASGVSSALSIIDGKTCNASTTTGCTSTKSVSTGGQDAIGVVVDEQTHTVYAVNGGSNSLAVINAQTCNAQDTSGCSKAPTLVNLPAGPEFLALNAKTNTIYVANTGAGSVSVVNGTTCNASDTSGCAKAPATVAVGEGAFPVAVDESTNSIYVGTLGNGGPGFAAGANGGGAVYVIDGNHCDSATTSGCGATPKSAPVGFGPAGIAVDAADGTVYVSSENGTVSVIDGQTCNASNTTGCATKPAHVAIGTDPRGNALDPVTHTLYATNADSNTLSLIDTVTCNALHPSGCATAAPTVLVGGSPRRIAIDPTTHTAYVVNVEDNTVSVINTQHCNATDQRGCPTQAPARTAASAGFGASGILGAAGPATNSSCSPTTVAASSGGPASTLTATATQVASGTIAGESWSLWSKKGQTGADGLEDAGLVVNGRAYGLCPGFPNPNEFELLDAGPKGVVYGVIGYPGKAKLNLSVGTRGSFQAGKPLPTPAVQVVNGVSFFIGTLPKSACDYDSLELDATSSGISARHNLGFGACTLNEIVPITSGQGAWGGTGLAIVSPTGNRIASKGNQPAIANVPLSNSNCSPVTLASASGRPASSLTATAKQVASGTIDGQSWSLWSKGGQSGATGLENAGLVVNGRAYGLCPGYPNPAELELLDSGSKTIVYGVIGYHGKAKVDLSVGTVGTFETGKALPAPEVHVVNGVSFFIGTLPGSPCGYSALELNSTSPGVSAEHDLGFGKCVQNQIVPITFSQGIWQLQRGKFVNNLGG